MEKNKHNFVFKQKDHFALTQQKLISQDQSMIIMKWKNENKMISTLKGTLDYLY